MKKFILVFAALTTGIVYGQMPDTLSLYACHELALKSFPTSGNSDLLSAASEIRQKRLNTNYLPQVQLNGQATYQSDVTKVDVEIPPFYIPPPIDMQFTPASPETPVPSNDQYKFTMDIYQVIYDGGITGKQKKVDQASYEIEKQQVEVEMHKLKENINQVYFSIIIMQENKKLLAVLLNELNTKLDDLQVALKNGVALQADADVLRAEIIRIEQQINETEIQKDAFVRILGKLISIELPSDIVLRLPVNNITGKVIDPARPELQLFDTQRLMLEESKGLISSTWMPRLSGFGQLGYGNPGLNFLENKWTPYYIVGARLNWKIWNWNQNKKDKQILGLRQDIVDRNRQAFGKNLTMSLDQHQADIRKYEQLISRDKEVIALRKNIAQTASSQLDNGVITPSDYVSRLNEQAQALLNLEIHKVKLEKARIDYLTTLGIL
ncbi:MAG: TolC family protein [Bacteroidales bacterium]|nr:TolC family protein [Bacteroidales bacterium]